MGKRTLQPCDKACLACGATFRCESAYRIRFQRYCSLKCSGAKGNGKAALVEKICPICDGTFLAKPSHKHRKTCSLACRSALYKSGVRSGEKSWSWKGGSTSYWKGEARSRDVSRCQFPRCRRLDVHAHHKLPRQAGGDDTLENLVTLCVFHHGRMERRLFARLLAGFPETVRVASILSARKLFSRSPVVIDSPQEP